VQRAFRLRFNIQPSTRKSICRWNNQFEQTGCLCKGKSSGRHISHFLHNIFTHSAFLFSTFKILNVGKSYKNELYKTVKISGGRHWRRLWVSRDLCGVPAAMWHLHTQMLVYYDEFFDHLICLCLNPYPANVKNTVSS
jgi:hypothetical protein